jgi:ParB-like chromosome segregation protein Spo0J
MHTGEGPSPGESENSDYLITLRDKGLWDAPVELVPVKRLAVAYTPRVAGEDEEYARTLAESEAQLPPILVHRPTMTVIDGVHRLRAASLKGHEHIAVRYFDGTETDAALLSVAANVAQGRPLSLEDRTAAAEQIFASHPHWSDRAVAAVAGLSARKVAQIRRHNTADITQTGLRTGRDGRVRPLSSARGRELAGKLIRENPGASLRQIAKQAGISPATVADVRDRLRRGDDPVPVRQRLTAVQVTDVTPDEEPPERPPLRAVPSVPKTITHSQRHCGVKHPAELLTIFESLRRDPSLRLNEAGRSVLRMLDACAAVARDRHRIVASIPAHCKESVSELADGYSVIWQLFADDLRRADDTQVLGVGASTGA